MKAYVITDAANIKKAVELTNYTTWAKLRDRDDWQIYSPDGVRTTVEGRLQINAGEWSYTQQRYLHEEWVTPLFVYLRHQCEGCHYPPSMCCLDVADFVTHPEDYERFDLEDMVLGSEAYEQAQAAAFALPGVDAELREIEDE